MENNWKIATMVLVVFYFLSILGVPIWWADTFSESTITGQVFIDSNENLMLDRYDQKADGLIVALYKLEEHMDNTISVKVAEVEVKHGEYQFVTKVEGEYCVDVVFHQKAYQLPYDTYSTFGETFPLKVESGEVVQGPIIFLITLPQGMG